MYVLLSLHESRQQSLGKDSAQNYLFHTEFQDIGELPDTQTTFCLLESNKRLSRCSIRHGRQLSRGNLDKIFRLGRVHDYTYLLIHHFIPGEIIT